MRKIWKQPGNSTRSNSQERAKWSCRSGKNGAAARQTSVSAEHQAAIAWISVEFALNAKQTEALADYISRDGIAYVLEKAEIVRSEPSRPHARSRPIPKQFADWKDHAQLKRASVPALRYSPPSFGFGQSARIRRDHLLPWRKRADAGWHLDIPSATVNRILRENKLQPHRLRTFTLSPDPQFGEKLLEVVALYMNPPENAVVLCVDEKTGIQALDRTQPMLPLRATKPRSWTNEYVRHGTARY
jgi:hypothetical protein